MISLVTHQCRLRPNIKNLLSHFVGLSNAFQNGMTLPKSSNDHREDRLQGKGLDPGQVLPGGNWAMVLPTHKLAETSLLCPENFSGIDTGVQKLFNIFCSTDRDTQNESPLYHIWV